MSEWDLLQHFLKSADADSVPLPDAGQGSAALAPMPTLAVGNKPAPGQTGPKGVSPRTSYSRVNSGSPPPADLGASTQKGLPTDPQSLLPPKVAHKEVPMSATAHYTIQDMIKAAAAGAHDQTVVSLEAARQLANAGESMPSTKLASAEPQLESIPTNYVEKLAAAVDFIVKSAEEPGPGTGPNALQVLEATSSNNEIEAGRGGTATSAHVPPQNPGLQRPAETPHGPANALEDNASMMHPEIPVKLSSADVEYLRKAAFDFSKLRSGAEGTGKALKEHAGKATAAVGEKAKKFGKDFVGKESGKEVAALKERAKPFGAHAAMKPLIDKAKAPTTKARAIAGGGLAAGGTAAAVHHNKDKHASVTVDELRKVAAFSLGGLREGAKSVAHKVGDEAKWQAGNARGLAKDVGKGTGKALESYAESVHGNLNAHGATAAMGAAGGAVAAKAHQVGKEHRAKKEASAVDPRLVDLYLTVVKQAEDAINPAKISAGAAVPPETSAAGESGGAPAGGMPEGPRGLVGSNESAINYQKREAKAPVKAQLAKVLTEPALSAAHDHTLDQAFDHTGQAGVKISSAVSTSIRSLAARAILEKLASEACPTSSNPKKKVSAGMGSFQAPPVGGVGSAGASM